MLAGTQLPILSLSNVEGAATSLAPSPDGQAPRFAPGPPRMEL